MPYLFNEKLFNEIGLAFEQVEINSELVEFSAPEHSDYLFLKLTTSVITPFYKDNRKSFIAIILEGDKLLTKICNAALNSIASVTLGFRWRGSYHDVKTITILGLAIKINYTENKTSQREMVIQNLCAELSKARLFSDKINHCDQILATLSRTLVGPKYLTSTQRCLFKPQVDTIPSELEKMKAYIKDHIAPIFQSHVYAHESNFNPTYQDIATVSCGLHENQKKIWVFRKDGVIAIGNKNANWVSFAENSLSEAIHHSTHSQIDWNDRYGHPSLAHPYPGYDGSVYYAGLLAQRSDHLEIYLSSGRYNRHDLNENDKKILESYIADQFQISFGNQNIIFIDSPSDNYYESSYFYYNRTLPKYCKRRIYTVKKTSKNIFIKIEGLLNLIQNNDYGFVNPEAPEKLGELFNVISEIQAFINNNSAEAILADNEDIIKNMIKTLLEAIADDLVIAIANLLKSFINKIFSLESIHLLCENLAHCCALNRISSYISFISRSTFSGGRIAVVDLLESIIRKIMSVGNMSEVLTLMFSEKNEHDSLYWLRTALVLNGTAEEAVQNLEVMERDISALDAGKKRIIALIQFIVKSAFLDKNMVDNHIDLLFSLIFKVNYIPVIYDSLILSRKVLQKLPEALKRAAPSKSMSEAFFKIIYARHDTLLGRIIRTNPPDDITYKPNSARFAFTSGETARRRFSDLREMDEPGIEMRSMST
ncbi:MAG: hypothetical protein NTZ67_07710 [Gammaproteobacteria bacterium]|nr:hypothetical protein [Gammaproteobacteria bacterium]